MTNKVFKMMSADDVRELLNETVVQLADDAVSSTISLKEKAEIMSAVRDPQKLYGAELAKYAEEMIPDLFMSMVEDNQGTEYAVDGVAMFDGKAIHPIAYNPNGNAVDQIIPAGMKAKADLVDAMSHIQARFTQFN